MTGRHATFNRGSISRLARFCRKALPLAFRLGSLPPKPWLRFAFQPLHVSREIPSHCRTLLIPTIRNEGGFDLTAEVYLRTAAMRERDCSPHLVSRGNLRELYWTFAQMFAHHTSNGCDLRPGDLLGSGTVSGPDPSARGCLLEITRGGVEPILLPERNPADLSGRRR